MAVNVQLDREEIDDLRRLFVSLLNEGSERALAIVAVAKIEKLLKDVAENLSKGNRLSFGERLNLLSARGLLHGEMRSGLKIMWKVRCKFAHDPNHCSFDDCSDELKELHDLLDIQIGPFLQKIRDRVANGSLATKPEAQFFAATSLVFSQYLLASKALSPTAPASGPLLSELVFSF